MTTVALATGVTAPGRAVRGGVGLSGYHVHLVRWIELGEGVVLRRLQAGPLVPDLLRRVSRVAIRCPSRGHGPVPLSVPLPAAPAGRSRSRAGRLRRQLPAYRVRHVEQAVTLPAGDGERAGGAGVRQRLLVLVEKLDADHEPAQQRRRLQHEVDGPAPRPGRPYPRRR